MTDPITKALQNHVRKDEPKSVEESIQWLYDFCVSQEHELEGHRKQIAELHNRIERLEGKISLDKLEALVTGDDIKTSELPHGADSSGCLCPTDALTQCPVCNEE